MNRRLPRRTGQTGTTLIEVLITIVVLTLGVVSLANLQVAALKLGQSTYQRSQAVALSYQILDSMRANRTEALAGRFDWRLGDPPPAEVVTGNLPLAEVQRWLQDIDRAMVPCNGVGGITHDLNRITVTIRWEDRYATERSGLGEPRFDHFVVVAEL